jgi:hypothetical protein
VGIPDTRSYDYLRIIVDIFAATTVGEDAVDVGLEVAD